MKIPRTEIGMRTPTFEKKSQAHFFYSFTAVFVGDSVTPMSTLAHNKRSCSKSGKFQAKIAFFLFSGEKIGTILSRRSRLSRTSRAPSRLSRPRPIDCDAGHDRQTMFSRFFEEEKHKKFFFRARHLVVIYTPKEAHSRIFVTGGQ